MVKGFFEVIMPHPHPFRFREARDSGQACSSPPSEIVPSSVHGSTRSPRTDEDTLKINYLAVRPERVERRAAVTTQSLTGERRGDYFFSSGLPHLRKRLCSI